METDSISNSNANHYFRHYNFDYNFHFHQFDVDYYNYSNVVVAAGQNIDYVVDQIDDEHNVAAMMTSIANDLWDNVMELVHWNSDYVLKMYSQFDVNHLD
jgi:hypothetical protein